MSYLFRKSRSSLGVSRFSTTDKLNEVSEVHSVFNLNVRSSVQIMPMDEGGKFESQGNSDSPIQ